MNIFEQQGQNLTARLNGETVLLCPWGKDSIRVLSSVMTAPAFTDWALLPAQKADAKIEITGNEASVTVGKIKAVIKRHGWPDHLEIAFYNQHGKLLLKEWDPGGALKLRARKFEPVLGGDYKLTASFEADENEKLYGMGQYQQEILNIKNCKFELAQRNSQASVPFVLSSLGYGFLWHNPAVGHALFGKNVTEWYAESSKQVDYWICAGDTPAEISAAYADATGHVPMMPEYGLGFWQCKLRYWNQEQLLEVAREYKRRKLPIDVIVCDFFHWPHMGDFRFEEEFFPDPKAMVDELAAMDIKLMVSVWPQIDMESENFNAMREQGLLVHTERGVPVQMRFGGESMFFDATNPAARSFVWEKCKQNYYKHGIQVFWLDEAEPEYGEYDFDNYRYHAGANVQVGNIYPQQYSRTFYEGMTGEGQKDVVNLVRCAWAGSQRYGALVWSGDIHSDFETFRRQVCAGLNMGIAGIPWWTTDIGGFSGGNPADPAFRELLIRWFQWGTFCPVMRLHGDRQPTGIPVLRKSGAPSLFTGSDNEVWSFGDEAYPILEKYLRLRETLRPYTRDLMREAHEKGAPVMRTMFYEFPGDEYCWELKDQYMFGQDILVAPVMEAGADTRSVYLPAGAEWTELASGKKYAGGSTITAAAPLAVIPVFLKNGRPGYVRL
ncbi:glycosyl hydrolase [Spirochaetia bacterium]|nr:glycosyl hydrolase [Spirochaetia bacterium]